MGLSNADLFRLASDMADRIEALTAERDDYKRLAEIADTLARECRIHESHAEAAEADNARLRDELTKAADSLDWADAHLEDAGVVSANVRYGARDARAALTGKETK
jgi:hypothetical protein